MMLPFGISADFSLWPPFAAELNSTIVRKVAQVLLDVVRGDGTAMSAKGVPWFREELHHVLGDSEVLDLHRVTPLRGDTALNHEHEREKARIGPRLMAYHLAVLTRMQPELGTARL